MERLRIRQCEKVKDNLLKIIFILFLVFTFIFNRLVISGIKMNANDIIEKDVQIVTNKVELFTMKYSELVKQMGNNQVFDNYLQSVQNNESSYHQTLKRYKVEHALKDIHNNDENVAMVWLGTYTSDEIISSCDEWSVDGKLNMENKLWYIQMINNPQKITFSSPYYDRGTGKDMISIVMPIYDEYLLLGNVGVNISIEFLQNFIEEFEGANHNNIMIVTDDGDVIVDFHDEDFFSREVNSNDINIWDELEPIYINDMLESYYYEKTNEIIILNDVGVNNWKIVSIYQYSYVYKHVNEVNIAFMFILVLSLFGIMVFRLFLRKNHDVGLLQEHAESLEDTKKKYDLAVSLTHTSIFEYNTLTNELVFSNNFNRMMPEMDTMNHSANFYINYFIAKEDKPIIYKAINNYIQGISDEVYCQVRVVPNSMDKYFKKYNRKVFDNKCKWVMVQGRPVYKDNEQRHLMTGIVLDITKLKMHEDIVISMAEKDFLTGLLNRRKFIEDLQDTIFSGYKGAVILIDLDNFKEINDTKGHIWGDKVLCKIATLLKSFESKNIFVARLGGDEFLLCLRSKTEVNDLEDKIHQLHSLLNTRIQIEGETIDINASIGVTEFPKDSTDINQLIMNADLAMYTIKNDMKNGYAFFKDSMRVKLENKSKIINIITEALESNGFYLVYQPQYNIKTSEILGYEALIRLKNNEAGPGEFIPVAEVTGQIKDIGKWVVKDVIKQLIYWQRKGLKVKPISINVSAKQLRDDQFMIYLKDIVSYNQISPSLINIEITENVMIGNEKNILNRLKSLKDFGFGIGLDDFGTGYSSISYLTYLPIDRVKLDKALIDDVTRESAKEMIKNIIALVHSLNLEIIAEGIESKVQDQILLDAGCDGVQGYYYCKPLEVEKAEGLLDK